LPTSGLLPASVFLSAQFLSQTLPAMCRVSDPYHKQTRSMMVSEEAVNKDANGGKGRGKAMWPADTAQ
jgi:hypothetical protein